MSIEDLHIKDI